MLAREARELGIDVHVQTPDPLDPATRAATSVVLAPLDDVEATRTLARRTQRISFENEWVPVRDLEPLEREGTLFVPSLSSLEPLLEKRLQRQLLNQLHLPSPHWVPMEVAQPSPPASDDLTIPEMSFVQKASPGDPQVDHPQDSLPTTPRLPDGFTFPVMAKMSRGGYDGQGTQILADQTALEHHWARIQPEEWILEEYVPFEMELAQLVCRDALGEVRCFPLVQTQQRDQVCDWVLFPAPVNHAVEALARNVAMSLVTSLNYVGVMGIEFFYGPRGLLVNEVAPRVHNSGHLTLEVCRTNQFAQQVRIVSGLPMGLTEPTEKGALMVNLLGYPSSDHGEDPEASYKGQRLALDALKGARLHWYGKSPRVGRKLGHVTFVLEAEDSTAREEERKRRLAEVRALWPWPEEARSSAKPVEEP